VGRAAAGCLTRARGRVSARHPQEWPSAKSSVPKEIADAKEDKCAMCTATDPTVY